MSYLFAFGQPVAWQSLQWRYCSPVLNCPTFSATLFVKYDDLHSLPNINSIFALFINVSRSVFISCISLLCVVSRNARTFDGQRLYRPWWRYIWGRYFRLGHVWETRGKSRRRCFVTFRETHVVVGGAGTRKSGWGWIASWKQNVQNKTFSQRL